MMVVVMVTVVMKKVLDAVVSCVRVGCDLVRIVCSNYLYMQLLGMNFSLEVRRNGVL